MKPPKSYAEVVEIFGEPSNSNLDKCETDVTLNHIFPKGRFWCHKLLVPIFSSVFNEIVIQGLQQELKTFDGCFNVRLVRGHPSRQSLHSWGIAIDLNAQENPLWCKKPKMSLNIVSIFKSHGFAWGGNFKRKDGMHFEFFDRS